MIVVDASVLANVLADDEADGDAARAAITGSDLAAPDLVDVETVSVLRRRWLGGDLTARRFRAAVGDLVDLPLQRVPVRSLLTRAYDLRANLTAYDAVYVALAETLDCPLVTADARLAAVPRTRCAVTLVRAP